MRKDSGNLHRLKTVKKKLAQRLKDRAHCDSAKESSSSCDKLFFQPGGSDEVGGSSFRTEEAMACIIMTAGSLQLLAPQEHGLNPEAAYLAENNLLELGPVLPNKDVSWPCRSERTGGT